MKNSFPTESDFRKDVIRVIEKPTICPVCGSNKITYMYGLPVFTEKLKIGLNEGTIKLGGCCISDDDPFCACLDCHTDFYEMIG